MKLARDTWLIFQRHMMLVGRSPIWILFGLAQPVTYVLLFAPLLKLALMLGRGLREVVMMVMQAVIITLLALPLGLSVGLGDLMLAYLLLALLSLMAVQFSYAITLKVRNEAALGQMINTVGQPVMLLAGVLLPLTLAPLWLQQIARWNPFYWATNGMRALFAGNIGATSVWVSLLIVIVLAVCTMTWSVRLFERSV